MNGSNRILQVALWIGFAVISATDATQAQQSRNCCSPIQQPINTSITPFSLELPTGQVLTPVVMTLPSPAWHAAFGQSHWIGPAAAYMNYEPGGNYTYTYRFCLCSLPQGVTGSVPAAMFVSVLADDDFCAYLNNTSFLCKTGGSGFVNPTFGSPPTSDFVFGTNVLTIVVHNELDGLTPTGLDASGWIAGYFGTCVPSSRSRKGVPSKPPR